MAGAQFPVVFLPGVLMPASARYAKLLEALDGRDAWPKDLELYAGDQPAEGYGIDSEVAGLGRFVDARGADRFHLYGHSAGGSIALAFAAEHGDRLISLALDEPATDFSAEDQELIAALWTGSLADLTVPQRMETFARAQVRPGVPLPAPPSGPPSPGMASRPAGLAAFERAIAEYRIDESALMRFTGPVYFSYGSLSNVRWKLMADRLAGRFRDIEVERYEGLHHLNTSHAAEPERVAAALQRLWGCAEESAAERAPAPSPQWALRQDVQGGTTAEGIHLGAMAGTVDIVLRCLTGMRALGPVLRLDPALPPEVKHLMFSVYYRGQRVDIELAEDRVRLGVRPGGTTTVNLLVHGQPVELAPGQERELALERTP